MKHNLFNTLQQFRTASGVTGQATFLATSRPPKSAWLVGATQISPCVCADADDAPPAMRAMTAIDRASVEMLRFIRDSLMTLCCSAAS